MKRNRKALTLYRGTPLNGGRGAVLALALLLFLGYVVLARYVLDLRDPVTDVALLWPAAGLAAGGVTLLWGYSPVGGVGAVAAAVLVANLLAGNDWLTSAIFSIANSAEVVLFVLLFRRKCGISILSIRDVGCFAGATVLASAGGALIGVLGLSLRETLPASAWFEWFLADLAGIITLAPLLLVRRSLHDARGGVRRLLLDPLMPVACGLATWLLVAAPVAEDSLLRQLPGVLLLPLALAAGLIVRPHVASWCGAAIVVVLTGAAVQQTGIFAPVGAAEQVAAMVLVLMLVIPPTMLTIALLVSGWRQAKRDQEQISEEMDERTVELERQVADSTAQLSALKHKLAGEIERSAQARAALEQGRQGAARREMTSGLAHDFNNLVAAIAGGFALIGKWTDDKRVREVAQHGGEAAARGGELVRQLIAAGQQPGPAVQPVYMAALLDRTLPLLRRAAPGGTVTLDCPAALPLVRCEPVATEGMVVDLVVHMHALMSGPDGGCALVLTGRHHSESAARAALAGGDYVSLSLSASGATMHRKADGQDSLSDGDAHAHADSLPAALAAAHAFVRGLGGALIVRESAGAAYVVQIYLPCAQAE
ncbi:MAG: hypothetical protein IT554_00520 [Sphingomonadaceae bacterium]|nr:hypothetical protein [Sphingomonadaceae bacterium]